MNKSYFGTVDPEIVAMNIVRDLDIDIYKPIDLFYVAKEINISVVKARIKTGILGACQASGLKRLVVLDPEICHEGRERFTFAHEIGHIALHHGTHCCRTEDFYWRGRRPSIEQDANIFAAELLMPLSSLVDTARKKDITIDLVEKLADERNVSVTAMGIKLIKITRDPTVLIYFEDDKIKWVTYSDSGYFLKLSNVFSSEMLDRMKETRQYKASTFFDNLSDETICWAEAKQYSGYGFYICIIRLSDIEYEYDEE